MKSAAHTQLPAHTNPHGCCVRQTTRVQYVHATTGGRSPPRQLPTANSLSRQPGSSALSEAVPTRLHVQHADPSQFWVASDVHCRVFHEEKERGMLSGPAQIAGIPVPQELLGIGPFMDRVDRVACLHALEDHAKSGAGKCVMLLAYEGNGRQPQQQEQQGKQQHDNGTASCTSQPHHDPAEVSPAGPARAALSPPSPSTLVLKSILAHIQQNPVLTIVLDGMLFGHMSEGLGVGAEEERLLGICFVDSFGDHVPARTLDARHPGVSRWHKRTGVAYISNVAVLPSARGRGVARRLVETAHSLARSWGCRAAGLHCNLKNVPAVGLYRSMGYKKTVLEPAIMPYLNGRPPDRCHFFLRRLQSTD